MIVQTARGVLKAAQPGQFFGWWVVAGCFAMATACWGLAFYGNGLYMAHLVKDRGWSIAEVSWAFTVYYWLGAILIVATGRSIDRLGPRISAAVGMLSMLIAVLSIAQVQNLAQLYGALVLLALGWAWMSGAAINATVARWFDQRRGAAVSLALTGASMGGIVVVPLMVWSIDRLGFATGVSAVAAPLALLVVVITSVCFVRTPALLGQRLDGAMSAGAISAVQAAGTSPPTSVTVHAKPIAPAEALLPIRQLLRSRAFLSNAVPFAFGLLAQAGLLTHQVTMLQEQYSRAVAAFAVAVTTAGAIVGRLGVGYFADQISRRLTAALNFAIQVVGLVLLMVAQEPVVLYLGCLIYGLAVGNMIAFPGLLVQREFSPAQFAHVTRWVTAFTQATYALGPALLGMIRQATGSYFACLVLCAVIGLLSSLAVWWGRPAVNEPSPDSLSDPVA